MSDINNQDNTEYMEARNFFIINESLSNSSEPKGETPQSIHCVYNFDICAQGQGQVIAIVGAFHYPTVLDDFNTFSKQFGLPVEVSIDPLAATNKVLQVIYARGTPPAIETGWALESALDTQWYHAMAPLAKTVLVESASNTYVDLFQAVDVANAIPGVTAISMSWGGYEFQGELAYDVNFKQPHVTYVAGAGDIGGFTIYPSVSQYVLSVGGTKINRNACGQFIGETAWSNGGGPSIFIPVLGYQSEMTDVAAKVGEYRATPDVSFDADKTSQVAIYTSTPYNGISGWTSLATPCWAGIIACINSKRKIPLGNNAQELLYAAAGKTRYTNPCCCYRDITEGQAGVF